jgi:hypothetical protein
MKKLKLGALLLAACISQAKLQAQCTASGSLYTANYSSGWSLVDLGDGSTVISTGCSDMHNGTISYSGTQASFVTARDAKELRLTSAITAPSNNSWTMDFKLTFNNPPSGGLANNSPSVILAALTDQAINVVSGCTTAPGTDFCNSCGSYPNTNMDGIWVALTSSAPTSCTSGGASTWSFNAYARDGNGTPSVSSSINIPAGLGTYYVRLQRTSSGGGVLSVFSNSGFTTHISGSPQCYTIPGSVTNLGYLSHEVHSQGGCFRVCNATVDGLKIDNGVTCPLSLTPSFTMASLICDGDQISVNGSASTGSPLGVSSYVWTVVESDASGNPATGATEWWSPWGSGTPGAYTMPSAGSGGPTLVCGKYYRVKLAVQNCGNVWAETSKVIFVACRPGLDLGPDQTICEGDCVLLNPGRPVSGYSYLWSEGSTTSSIAVCPPVTTTYCVTKTDLSTGCTSTDCVTINVVKNDPSFSLFVNTAPSSYCTVSLTANDLSGFSQPGFTYALNISELDGSGNPYYYDGGTNCWWNYPSAETFQGYVSTGTGTYTQSAWWSPCPGAGQFLYGHTYKITRTTWNDYCPQHQSSITITPVKAASGYVLASNNEDGAPSSLLTAVNSSMMTAIDKELNVNVYPNPNNGVFSVDLSESLGTGTIEVFDALGKKIQTLTILSGTSHYKLDLSKYGKSMYMLNITSNGKKASRKLIVE